MTIEQFNSIPLKSFIEVNGNKYLVESRFTKMSFFLLGKKNKTALLRKETFGTGMRIEFSLPTELNQTRRFTTTRYVSSFKQL